MISRALGIGGSQPEIERILIPVDGSSNSNRALEFAINLARKCSAEIYLLHVMSFVPIYLSDLWEPFHSSLPYTYFEESEEEGEDILASASDKVGDAGIKSFALLDHGRTASKIIQTAEEWRIDLIVLGSENRSLIAKLFLGSVSDEVTHKAPCPVLLVKNKSRKGCVPHES
ncbi:MAG: universal stress protein [Candidatus Bathyarchaeota archaeon]|nr:universal stress protein [Candidatus Bathyarchaeota archaeon]